MNETSKRDSGSAESTIPAIPASTPRPHSQVDDANEGREKTPHHEPQEQSQEQPQEQPQQQADSEYPSMFKRTTIMASLYISMFLVILDQTIISTAIPRITDEFHSINDVGWYGSSFLLTTCAFQLFMGKIYKVFAAKPVFLAAILVFEIGSAICGAAPNSEALIVGRAIAGVGSSGIFSGVMIIMFHIIPLQERPAWQGGIGAILGIGSAVGPLLGGVFTDKVTWRWCFYINLPVGAVTLLVVILMLKLPNQKLAKLAGTWTGVFKQLDILGNLCVFPAVVSLILALQWGGTTYNWGNARIVVLFVVFGLMTVAFLGIQIWQKEDATIPPRLVKQRSIAAATFFSFFMGAANALPFYLPIWFQAVKNASALKSGIMLLPMVLSTVLGTISSGVIISKIGYYNPFFLLSSILMPVGAGLISSFTPSTGAGEWIGYQILFGLGVGLGVQQPMNVCQAMLDKMDISAGVALVTFVRFVASAIFLPVGENIFLNTLVEKLTKNLPNIDPDSVTSGGATELRDLVSGDDLGILIDDYNLAIRNISYMTIVVCALTIFGSVFIEWRSLKPQVRPEAKGGDTESGSRKGDDVKQGDGSDRKED